MAYYTYKRQVKLLPGQTLKFARGKGYYADAGSAPQPYPGGGPAEPHSGVNSGGSPYAPPKRPPPTAPPPKPPPAAADPYGALSQQEIDRRATALAQAGLTPQQAEVRRQQELAARNARADEGAIQGFQTAAAGLMAGLGPQAEAGFLAASKEEGDLGQGMATGVQQDLTDRAAADQAFAASQGQQTSSTVDPNAAHDVIYGLNGQIPGDTFAEQGATMNQWGLAQAPIALNAGREEIAARMAQARQDNDGYAQQLLQLAAQFPGLKAQALQQLNQYEMDKASYRETRRVNTANIASQKKQDATAARSLHDQEVAAGIDTKLKKQEIAAEYQYKYASLQLRSAEDKAKLAKAAREGKRIDASASKVVGHVVYKDGTEDPSIKVAQSGGTTTTSKALANRGKAVGKANVKAYEYATKLLGKPVKNKNQGAFGGKGIYLASPQYAAIPPGHPGATYHTNYGKPGDVATTDRPGRAARDGAGATDYADAQTKVWAEIDGDGLMARYGLSREQVMGYVNKALRRAGWKRK